MLGKKIKELRVKEGLSQERFAQEIGFSQAAISAWENSSREPGAFALIKLAKFFNTTVDYLLNGTTKKAPAASQLEEKTAQAICPDGKELLDIYTALSPEFRVQVLEYARYFAARSKNVKKK